MFLSNAHFDSLVGMYRKLIYRAGNIVILLVCSILLFIHWYSAYEDLYGLTPAWVAHTFWSLHDRVISSYFFTSWYRIHYLDIGDLDKPILFFIHGAPWSIKDRTNVLKKPWLLDTHRAIVIDRLGYWKSAPWVAVTDITTQSSAYTHLLQTLSSGSVVSSKPLLIWHSYWGPIAFEMALEMNNNISWVLSLASAVDPATEKQFLISPYIRSKVAKWLLGNMIWVANEEKFTHKKELQASTWRDQISVPVHAYHGSLDSIVPYASLLYLNNLFAQHPAYRSVTLTWLDHALQFTHPDMIVQAIDQFSLPTYQ